MWGIDLFQGEDSSEAGPVMVNWPLSGAGPCARSRVGCVALHPRRMALLVEKKESPGPLNKT